MKQNCNYIGRDWLSQCQREREQANVPYTPQTTVDLDIIGGVVDAHLVVAKQEQLRGNIKSLF